MAVLFMEGFDTKSMLGWSAEPTSYTPGRVTGESAQITTNFGINRSLPAAITTISAGFATYSEALTTTPFNMFEFYSSVGPFTMLALEISNGDALAKHFKGTPSIGSYPAPGITITPGEWNQWEVSLVLGASGSAVIKCNGNTIYNYTGDTRNGAFPGLSVTDVRIAGGGLSTSRVRFDDLYITDTSTALGDCIVQTLLPTSDSTPSAWTPSTGTAHYAVVDEVPPTYADYLSTTAGGNFDDTYKVTVPGGLTANSLAVEVRAHALKTDAGTAFISMLADGQASSVIGVPTTSGLVSAVFPTAAAGATWTPAKLTSASFGVRDST